MNDQPDRTDGTPSYLDPAKGGDPGAVIDKPDDVVAESSGEIALPPKKDSIFNHPLGFWFFFWGEFAERSSYYGMRAILAVYMAEKLGLGQANAATYVSVFIAACYFLPLVGGWVADNYLGKYWTIVGFSLPYILGHVILGIENIPCLVIALSLLAMGSGVIKPNISTLMGLTYDQQRPGQTKLRSDAFAIFYFSINIGAALSQFAMPAIRTEYGYAIAFLFPAALMVVSFTIFAAGKPFYAREVIQETTKTPEQRAEQWRVLGRILGLFLLVMFFWAIFDQAASTWIFFTESCMDRHVFGYLMDADQMQAFNPLFILLLLPPITVGWRVLGHFGVNVRATDKMIVGFGLTAVCMGVMAYAAWRAGAAELRPYIAEGQNVKLSVEGQGSLRAEGNRKLTVESPTEIAVSGADKVFGDDYQKDITGKLLITGEGVLKLVRDDGAIRIEGKVSKIEHLPKEGEPETLMNGDLRIALAGEAETSERWFVDPRDQVTVWWLIGAYLIITMAEVLISVTGLELAYTAAPKSMTGFVTACWLLTVALADLLINAPVVQLYPMMQPYAYFGMFTVAMVVVTLAFLMVARRFNRYVHEEPAPAVPGDAGGHFGSQGQPSEGITDPRRVQGDS
jgi:dipeptide/tripeptide permease